MDEKIIESLYQNVSMGQNSLTNLLNDLKEKDNKIKELIAEEIKEYEKYLKEINKIIKKEKFNIKNKGIFTDIAASMGIKKEVKKDNSDASVASMIIQGFTMGNLELTKIIDKKPDKKLHNIAKELLDFGNQEIEKLKTYL